jgi:hypothetical protein
VNTNELDSARTRKRQQLPDQLVTSFDPWNEWGRTTYSEPYIPHGKACLEVTKRIFLHEGYGRLTNPILDERRMSPYTQRWR